MERRYYKCTFLTDIVLNSTSATEGHSETLDYIPGSNFLGIVAKGYEELGDEAYKIFHSGNVHFGDGHLMIENKRSMKKPAYWFYEKMDTDIKKIYLHHKISDAERTNLSKEGKQLKQIRNGYFSINENKIIPGKINHSYSLKSAYDADKRGSKDQAMFGYDALNSGSEWLFFVDADAETIKSIENYLLGEKSIGRSKTAQYGRVNIQKLDNYEFDISCNNETSFFDEKTKENKNLLLIYFDSCAVFLDNYQQPTFQPSLEDLQLDDSATINWHLSQIRTKEYSPWNGIRKTRDFDRVCIDKGSVIAVEIPQDFNLEEYSQKTKFGIGLFKNEGLGQILVNPSFITKSKGMLLDIPNDKEKSSEHLNQYIVENGENDKTILRLLNNLKTNKDSQIKVLEKVNSFVEENESKMKNISSSQWGQVRSIAMKSQSTKELLNSLFAKKDDNGNELPDERKGFLVHGKAEPKWRNKHNLLAKAIEDLSKSNNIFDEHLMQFLINVASDMAKKAKKGDE